MDTRKLEQLSSDLDDVKGVIEELTSEASHQQIQQLLEKAAKAVDAAVDAVDEAVALAPADR